MILSYLFSAWRDLEILSVRVYDDTNTITDTVELAAEGQTVKVRIKMTEAAGAGLTPFDTSLNFKVDLGLGHYPGMISAAGEFKGFICVGL